MAEAALAFPKDPEEILYPESDGEPMAETDEHRDDLAEIVFTLDRHFRDQADVYVSGNLFVYYQKGDPTKCRAPDVFVVLGVPKTKRRNYKLWEEGQAPVMAIELTSKKTRKDDEHVKPGIYARLGVQYLFLYDVLGEYLDPPLQGKRLGPGGRYQPLLGPGRGPLPCPPLGLDLVLDEAGRLQFVERATGKLVVRERVALDQSLEGLRATKASLEVTKETLEVTKETLEVTKASLDEEAEARRQADERAEQEAEARQRAEAQNREMAAEIERLRGLLDDRDPG